MQAIPVRLTRFWWLPLAVAVPILLIMYWRNRSEGFRRPKKTPKPKRTPKPKSKSKSKSSKSKSKGTPVKLRSLSASDDGSGGQTMTGTATFYWAKEKNVGYGTGATGACYDNKLKPFYSLAVKCGSTFKRLQGMMVEYKLGDEDTWRQGVIEDQCDGPHCRDIDVYVGTSKNSAYNNRRPITYRLLGKDPGNKCTNLDYEPGCKTY